MSIETIDGKTRVIVYGPGRIEDIKIKLTYKGETVFEETAAVSPVDIFTGLVDFVPEDEEQMTITITKDDRELLSYTPHKSTEPVPSPAEAIPEPDKLETTEKLFLAATHLEQYRHATYSPEPYYLEGLKRDPSDIRLNNGYGKYLYNRGRAEESVKYFKAAIKSSTWKNPNPYDCEPYYNLGISLKAIGDTDAAFDAFYKAAWDGNQQDKAFYQLAAIAAGRGDFAEALEYVEKSLVKGAHNMRARTLKTAILRLTGDTEKAALFARETMAIDPLDHGSRYELYLLTGEGLEALNSVMRGDNHNYIELALTYMAAYLYDEADKVLALAPNNNEPMVHYYRYFCTGDAAELEAGEKASSLYCFPNRTDDIAVLYNASDNGGNYSKYYLGCLFYDKGVWERSVELWEACADKIELATVYRNLSLAYYNKLHDADRARWAMEKAFDMDKTDARVFFELDQLYRTLNLSPEERFAAMEVNCEIVENRDDLYTEYITLLNLRHEYDDAYDRIMKHSFHPWEGGEGKIPAQYRKALINKAKREPEKAIEYLEQALTYPYNLGEGKLIGSLDNDIYYMLGGLYEEREKKEWAYRMAARGEFLLTSAMYYNDQPPEMTYYAALALRELGDAAEADRRFDCFIKYAKEHMDDNVKIEYFAVSLPDFLIFEGDLNMNNKVHCCYMAALGALGKGDKVMAKEYAEKGLKLNKCHAGLLDIIENL